jgi:hypothetical protein
MGPPRRKRSGSSTSVRNSPHAQRARQQRVEPPVQPASTSTKSPIGMSATSRYNHNLKVLRRRDPSIVSIFDQFSHVCVYHHNGSKWEKQGFEGTMFLYERYVKFHLHIAMAVMAENWMCCPPNGVGDPMRSIQDANLCY